MGRVLPMGSWVKMDTLDSDLKGKHIWLIGSLGAWPANHIDHINHETTDNRMANLRDATRSENNRNARSRNPLGKGVQKHGRGFESQIRHGGKVHCLGTFRTPEDAAAAYAAAADLYHAEFACTEQAEAGA